MDYELAKQLKDAGFPQDTEFILAKFSLGKKPVKFFTPEEGTMNGTLSGELEWEVPDPTLSELIDACGDGFDSVDRVEFEIDEHTGEKGIIWQAYPTEDTYYGKMNGDCMIDCCGYETGDTPEEAVAKLWLKLNK